MKNLFVVAYLSTWVLVQSHVEFTNMKCTSLDKPFADFEHCFLKSVNRSYKYMSLKVNLFQVPLSKISITVAVLKRANGFKPFLYNITVDACKYLKSRNGYKFFKFFHEFFESYSNMNHTCPYNHDVYVDKLPISQLNDRLVNLLPLPEGVYRIDTMWHAYNIPRTHVEFQFAKT